jgi:hypothetical protein
MKPKPLLELNYFRVPMVMTNPFIASEGTNAPRTMKAIFEGKVRSERGASRAQTKAQRANFDKLKIAIISANVNL